MSGTEKVSNDYWPVEVLFVREPWGQGRYPDGVPCPWLDPSLQRTCRLTPLTIHPDCSCGIEWRRSCRRFHKGQEIL